MSEEQINRINELADLSARIVNDREFAKQFAISPKRFSPRKISQQDESNYLLDDALLKIVEALADDDIAEAITNKDIKQYLLLMHSKGYIDDVAKFNDYNNLMTLEDKKIF